MRLRHDAPVARVSFDDPNLVLCAGLVPLMALRSVRGLRCPRISRVVAQRVRRRWLWGCGSRRRRGGGLMTRLVPSEPALVMPVCRNVRICGHQVCTVLARRASSGRSELLCSDRLAYTIGMITKSHGTLTSGSTHDSRPPPTSKPRCSDHNRTRQRIAIGAEQGGLANHRARARWT